VSVPPGRHEFGKIRREVSAKLLFDQQNFFLHGSNFVHPLTLILVEQSQSASVRSRKMNNPNQQNPNQPGRQGQHQQGGNQPGQQGGGQDKPGQHRQGGNQPGQQGGQSDKDRQSNQNR
jgi:hypothetical protein